MAFIFDLTLLLILLLIVVSDIKKGFLCASVGFARVFIAFALAFLFSSLLASLFNRLWIFPAVHGTVQNALSSTAISGSAVVSAIPAGLRAIAALNGIDLQKIADNTSASDLSNAMALPISQCISAALAFVFLLIGSYFALKLLLPLLSRAVHTISFLKAADTVGGAVFGVFHALLIGWVLSFVGGFLLSLFGTSLDETYVIRFFNHVSPIKAIVWIFFR